MDDDRGRLQVLKLIIVVGNEAALLADLLEEIRQAVPPHPALLPVNEIGVSEEGVYLASPVLNSPSVEGRLRDGRQSLEATVPWLSTLTDGLQAAHDAGVHHGALHPRDVLVTENGGVLTGVGIAPALERLKLQAPIRVPFTAPERASGGMWDARADQYSLAMLALDALSGRRLIAGTIPAFDRWTLAETPTEDARLHEVFVRALHPDPDLRYPSLDAWFAALAGPEREAESGALSRFAREGVILASPAVAADPGRDIKVQPLEDPEGVALSLFPEEDGTIESPVAEAGTRSPDRIETTAESEADQEWLVADVPDEAPSAEPETEAFTMRYMAESPAVEPPTVTVAPAPEWHFEDSRAVPARSEPTREWELSSADTPNRRPWFIVVAMLVLAALAYGTWNSLQRPDGPASTTTERDAKAADTSEAPPSTPPDAAEGPATTEPGVAPPVVPQAPITRDAVEPPARSPRTAVSPPAASPSGSAPASAPAPATGRMLIRSSPSGEVSVNGVMRGRTPIVLRDLPFGRYTISVTRPGFATAERELALAPSQPVASVSLDLPRQGTPRPASSAAPAAREPASAPGSAGAPGSAVPAPPSPAPSPASAAPPRETGATGSIVVSSVPVGARLFVDGQAYGTTPASVPGLSEGGHTIRVEAPGYKTWEGRVAVIAGTRVPVQATLQQDQR